MSLQRRFLQFMKFFLTLWLTISCVFLLSRLLPNANSPKGLTEADANVYGVSDASTIEKVKADYLKRAGLDLPLFYFHFELRGSEIANNISIPALDRLWFKAAVLRHGLPFAYDFFKTWQKWNLAAHKEENDKLAVFLLGWSKDQSPEQLQHYSAQITRLLNISSSTGSDSLLSAWTFMRQQRAPIYYYLPQVKWQGTNNAYHNWMQSILQGDLGVSSVDYRPVADKIREALYASALMGFLGLFLAVLISFYTGLYFTLHRENIFTVVGKHFLYWLDSVPGFVITLSILGIYLVIGGSLFSPISSADQNVWLSSLLSSPVLLGSCCITLFSVPHLTLQFHKSLELQSTQVYVRTALAKGYSYKTAIRRHVLPNSLVPSLTIVSEMIIGLISGVLIVEITFSIPGLGTLLVKAILAPDYPIVIGVTLLLLVFRLAITQLSDLVFALLDPRLRN